MNDRTPPKIPDAPGLVLKMRNAGWAAVWQPRTDLRKPWGLKNHTIMVVPDEPSPEEIDFVQIHCQRLQSQMLKQAHGVGGKNIFDGTIASLINCYQTDDVSPYHKTRYATRLNYDSLLRRINKAHGATAIAEIKSRDLLRWHKGWLSSGVYSAHGLMGMVRIIIGFGATLLEDEKGNDECARIRGLLSGMKFENGKPRNLALTPEYANAIRAKAHELGYPEVALAQAFQFECTLRQKDVIGEWVPQSEPGPLSDILNPRTGRKWIRGLRWQEINNLTLVHVTSKRGKPAEVNLRLAPMVMEELGKLLGGLPTSGPVIIDPETGRPYLAQKFREQWREVATAAGVPREYWNMDTRAGAITEATASGANLEDVRHAATHSNIAMTQRYSRDTAKKVEKVMQLRVASRNKNGTNGS